VLDPGFLENIALDLPAHAFVKPGSFDACVAEEARIAQYAEGVGFEDRDELATDSRALKLRLDRHLHELADALSNPPSPRRTLIEPLRRDEHDNANDARPAPPSGSTLPPTLSPDGMVHHRHEVVREGVDRWVVGAELLHRVPDGREQHAIPQLARLRVEPILIRDAPDAGLHSSQCTLLAMARKTLWEDEYTLLCERCGYVIEGLDTDGACPECGKPIVESLPERRTGTPWQRDEEDSLRILAATWWQTLRSPLKTVDELQAEHHRSHKLLVFTLLATCAPATMAFVIFHFAKTDLSMVPAALVLGLLMSVLLIFPSLFLMAKIEQFTLSFSARRRGWRVDSVLAGSLCAHGTVCWLVGSAACPVFLALSFLADDHRWYPEIGSLRIDASRIFSLLAVLTAFAGLLIFEGFVYIGLRRCKYANRVRSPAAPEPDDPEGS